jgi:hypothetical protein
MPICGLLITLDSNQLRADAGILQLTSDTRITLGERIEKTLQPAILETKTAKEARDATNSARTNQGILEVHVVSVDFQLDRTPLTQERMGANQC